MSYQVVTSNSQILAVHAALLRSSKVLYFSGSQHIFPSCSVDATRLWNPATSPPSIERVASPEHDLFCSGHAFLQDGKLLVSGGTQGWDVTRGGIHGDVHHFRGLRETVVFNPGFTPGTTPWRKAAPMVAGISRGQAGVWSHLSQIPSHSMQADFDCSTLSYPAKFAVAGDFDCDGAQEIAVAPEAPGSAGNDFWVMKFDASTRSWSHLPGNTGHPMEADFDCSTLSYPAKFAVVGDFDGDGRDQVAVAPEAAGSAGNDFWVMKYDSSTRVWKHLNQIPGHPMQADFDCSALSYPTRFAVAADFDRDGLREIAVAPDADGSAGNDFWVMQTSGRGGGAGTRPS